MKPTARRTYLKTDTRSKASHLSSVCIPEIAQLFSSCQTLVRYEFPYQFRSVLPRELLYGGYRCGSGDSPLLVIRYPLFKAIFYPESYKQILDDFQIKRNQLSR